MAKKALLIMLLMALFAPWVANAQNTCEAPTNFYAEHYGLFWSGGSGTYNLQEKAASSNYWTDLQTDYTGTELYIGPCDGCQYRIQSVCGNVVSDWVTTTFYMPQSNCMTPYNLDVTPYYCDGTTAQLMWDVSPVNMFEIEPASVQICFNGNMSDLIEVAANALIFDLTDLTPGTTYTVKMRGKCDEYTYSDWSSEISFTTEETYPCLPPTNLAWIEEGGSYYLTWEGSSGYYNLQYKAVGGYWTTLVDNFAGEQYDLSNLTLSDGMQFRVQGQCGDCPSEFVSITISMPTVCEAPTNFHVSEEYPGAPIYLYWEGGSGTYNLQRRAAENTNWTTMETNYTGTSYDDFYFSVTDGYQFRIQSVCDGSVSDWVMTTYHYIIIGPDDPEVYCQSPSYLSVESESDDGTKANVWWDYEIIIDPMEDGGVTPTTTQLCLNGDTTNIIELNGSILNYILTGLTPGTTYTVQLRGKCSDDWYSDWSETSFTTGICEAPNTFVLDEEGFIGSGNYYLEWTGGSGVYRLEYKEASAENWTVLHSYYNNNSTIFNLDFTPSDQSQFRIQSICDEWASEWVTITFNTPQMICVEPLDVQVEPDPTDGTMASLSWGYFPLSQLDIEPVATQICLNGDMNNLILVGYGNNQYTLTDLSPATTYTVKLRGKCYDDMFSEWSEEMSFTTAAACQVPTGFDVYTTEESYMWANAIWDDMPDAASYNIEINGVVENLQDYDYYSYDWTFDVEYNTTYTVRVQSVCSNGFVSDWTEPVVFSTPTCPPENRCEFTVELRDDSGSGWDEGILQVVDVATGDVLYSLIAADATPGIPIQISWGFGVCNGIEAQLVWNGPTDNLDQYTFVLSEGYNGWGVGNGEEIISGSPSLLPFNVRCDYTCLRPSYVYVDYNGGAEATVYWDSEASLFNISVNGVVTNNVTEPYIITDLEGGTEYEVKVQTVCGEGASLWSAPASFTTSICPIPENFSTAITEEAIMWATAYWSDMPGASSYNIEINGVVENISDGDYYYYEYPFDIEPSTTYTVRMQTVCSSGLVSDWTEPSVFTTPECQPEARCVFEIEFHDASGYGWNEGLIQVLDVTTGEVLSSQSAAYPSETYPAITMTWGFSVCTGHEFQLVWNGPTYEYDDDDPSLEISPYTFIFREANASWGIGDGDVILTGDPSSLLPYNYSCGSPVVVQEVAMQGGSDWYSFEVEITLEELQAALVAAMPAGYTYDETHNIMITSSTGYLTYNGVRWRGNNFGTWDPSGMYLISIPEDCTFNLEFEGTGITPDNTITIHYGSNWMVFPPDQNPMTLFDAFNGFAVSGDMVLSKNGGTATYNGIRWRGTLNTLVPGECYIYSSVVNGDRVLNFPSSK